MSSLLTTLLLLSWTNSVFTQSCNGVSPTQFWADPSTFRGVVIPLASQPQCRRESVGYNCLYSTILGDNDPVPPHPNLENSGGGNSDVGKFLVWPNSTDRPYVNFRFNSMQLLTGINIEFLNYPAQGFSLPNLELYSVVGPTIVDPNSPLNQHIEFELQNNNVLSQDDYQVTTVSLIFSNTSQYFLLYWNYTGVYNLDFFMVSEIDFCSNTQPPGETQITFQDPQSDNSVIIPTVEELTIARHITLNCTVSSSGLFEWQWRQNETVLSNNIRFSLFTADGTRTSILRIVGLNVGDAANYVCEVRRRSSGGGREYVARTQILSFSVIVDLPDQLTGYLGEGRVVLICDVHGFLRSTNPPIVWLGRDGSSINSNTSKYTIESSVLSDGTSVPGLRSTLTINDLEVEDEGTYTCVVDGTSTTAQLTIVTGSTPPVTSMKTGIALWVIGVCVAIGVIVIIGAAVFAIAFIWYKVKDKVNNSDGNIEMRPNEVYGMIASIKTVTPNEGHGMSNTDIKTTPNEVYGLMTSR